MQFYIIHSNIWQAKRKNTMAHIGFLQALRGVQPNNSEGLTKEEHWRLLQKLGGKQKPSQDSGENLKVFQNRQNYREFVNAHVGESIRESKNRFKRSNDENMDCEISSCGADTISADFLKKKIHFEQNFPTILKEMDEEATCSICLEILVLPVLTDCGHAFCLQCIDEHLLFSSVCPNCRDEIKDVKFKVDLTLDKLVRSILSSCNDALKIQSFQERMQKCMVWRLEREVDSHSLEIGNEVDIRDTQLIWCKGQITDLYFRNNELEAVLVHYAHWHRMYDEVIDIPSFRLAPIGFFTNRTDINCYQLQSTEDNMRGLVISAQTRAAAAVNHEISDEESENSSQNEANEPENEPTGNTYSILVRRLHRPWNQINIMTEPSFYLYSYPYHPHNFIMLNNQDLADQDENTTGNAERQRQEDDQSMEQEEREQDTEY